MQVFKKCLDLQNHLNELSNYDTSIGFVPTMGALHEGHKSLVEKSLEQNNTTVVSIYVNPTQFDNREDLLTYPSNVKNDINFLKSISDDLILFNPDSEEIYCGEVKLDTFNFNGLEKSMEGRFRVNHFNGVATVVNKLFSIVKSDNVYFGEKDFQQLRIIENLVFERKINTKVVRCETIRGSGGLALSSRNDKLSFSSKKNSNKFI